jgi:hypothetical protein
MLGLAAAAAALLGATALLARPKLAQWKDLRSQQERLRQDIELDKALIAQKARWDREFEELSGMLPLRPADEKMDVHWLAVMDQVASRHGVRISKRRAGDETQEGDVFEMPIEVEHDGWEGPLDALVHFLFDLQTEGAMLDIRQLLIKPASNGQLAGRFSLYCAYRREGAAPKSGQKEGTTNEKSR